MPWIQKTCILCGNWIKRSRRKRNCLCLRCIGRLEDAWVRGGIAEVTKVKNKMLRARL